MKGMCYKCMGSNLDVRLYDGEVMCQECFGNKFPTKSYLNEPEPTFNDLKKQMERKF